MLTFIQLFQRLCQTQPRHLPVVRRKSVSRLVPSFNTLEPRRTLAGNVFASLVDGNLMLAGDDLNNSVEIVRSGNQVVVNGLDGTTINNEGSITISGNGSLRGKLTAWLYRGDDQIFLRNGVGYPDSIEIHGGLGEDTVGLEGINVTNDVYIDTDYNADSIIMSQTNIGRHLTIVSGGANDLVSLRSVTVGGNLRADTGNGADGVEISLTTVRGATQAKAGRGDDTFSLSQSQFQGGANFGLGRGDDIVRSDRSQFSGQVKLKGESGDDSVQFTAASTLPGGLKFDGGSGSDRLGGSGASTLGNGQSVRSADIEGLNAALFTQRLDASGTGLISRADAKQELLIPKTVGDLTLAASLDSSKLTQSSGIQITQAGNIDVSGTSIANARIEISRDGDGVFDDGSLIVGADGTFVLPVALVNNSINQGVNNIVVRATDSSGSTLTQNLPVYFAQGTVVRMASNRGNIDFEFFDDAAPLTVANFMGYLEQYSNSIIHRSAKSANGSPFIIQGGGFALDTNNVPVAIDANPPVQNEFGAERSNVRGTLALALPGDNINGGTSSWFINMTDNSTLDQSNFTVFGRVIGNGMDIADAIHDLPTIRLQDDAGVQIIGFPVGDNGGTPIQNYSEFSQDLAGTVSIDEGSDRLKGVGTDFLNNRSADGRIQIGDSIFQIAEVISLDEIRLTTTSTISLSDVVAKINPKPTSANFVLFSSISELDVPGN